MIDLHDLTVNAQGYDTAAKLVAVVIGLRDRLLLARNQHSAGIVTQHHEGGSIMNRLVCTAVVVVLVCIGATAAHGALTKCRMDFTVSGWSAIYKTASGSGTITCDDGQKAAVHIRTKGGGLTVGKSKISGHGTFSEVSSINEVFGSYAEAEAHAGAGPSKAAQVMTKGPVSLELTGSGQGVDLGFSFGGFTITRAGAARKHK